MCTCNLTKSFVIVLQRLVIANGMFDVCADHVFHQLVELRNHLRHLLCALPRSAI